jgi:hypothetical protein
VWQRGHFGWEYKGKHKDLKAAYVQLQQYAVALENPPLLVVCDLEQFRIHTNWTNTVQQVYDLTLDDLYDPEKLQILKWVFSDAERLKPGKPGNSSLRKPLNSLQAWRNGSARGGMNRTRSPISSTGWCSACLQRTWACCLT